MDPYSTSAPSYSPPVYHTQGGVDPLALQALQGTKPWVRLCSVIGFIGSGFMILGAVGMVFAGTMVGTAQNKAIQGMPMAGLGIVYGLLAVLYLFPSIKLWKYGSAIVRLLGSNQTADLIEALEQQRSFWKFVGILILIMIALYIVAILMAVVFATTFARH